jgi:hypothetical protein
VSSFKYTGNCDDVCAQLKASFEASEAQFNTTLQALLNQGPSVTPAVAAKPAAAAPAAAAPHASAPHASAGWSLDSKSERTSSRTDADPLRGRMRTSLRVNTPR